MDFPTFHNALRVLLSTDRIEYEAALNRKLEPAEWLQFRANPFTSFIKMDRAEAERLYAFLLPRIKGENRGD